MTTTTNAMKDRAQAVPISGWAASIILTVAGLAAWIYQLVAGMSVTGYSQQVVWGLYIAAFFSAAAAGAGLLFLVGLSEFVPLAGLARRKQLLMMSIASFVAAAFLILMDIGHPTQAWRLITAFRLNVPMTWDFWFLVIAGVVALVYLLSAGESSRLLGALGMLAALALVIVEGILLASNASHPMWGGLTIVSFLVGALVAGLALTMLVLPKSEALKFSPAIGWALAVSLVLVLVEVLASAVSPSQHASDIVQEVLTGLASPFFWFQVVAGLLLPLVLLKYVSASWKITAVAVLALLGVLAEKSWMLIAEQAHSWVGLPHGSYFPSWVEFLAVVGACALGVLIYQLLVTIIKPEKA